MEKNDALESLIGLASIQNQTEDLRLHGKLGQQIFREVMDKVFEPVTVTVEDVSKHVTKTMTETSK